MRKIKHSVGVQNGHKYTMVFDQFKNQQGCDDCIRNKWAWFLKVEGEYVGNFPAMCWAIRYMDKMENTPLTACKHV
jgi:hypothetical protein